MKILAFAASNSSTSINKALASFAADLFQSKVNTAATIELLDLNDYEMPIYSSDRENADGIPALAQQFREKIAQAGALIISHAEHNGALTAAYKNVFDWTSRIDQAVFQQTPTVMLATSPGPGGGARALDFAVNAAPHFGGNVQGSLSVPSFYDNFDMEKGALTDEALVSALLTELKKL